MQCYMVTILGFAVHTVSVEITQLCCCSTKAATGNTQMNGCGYVPVKLYFKKRQWATVSTWPRVWSLLEHQLPTAEDFMSFVNCFIF